MPDVSQIDVQQAEERAKIESALREKTIRLDSLKTKMRRLATWRPDTLEGIKHVNDSLDVRLKSLQIEIDAAIDSIRKMTVQKIQESKSRVEQNVDSVSQKLKAGLGDIEKKIEQPLTEVSADRASELPPAMRDLPTTGNSPLPPLPSAPSVDGLSGLQDLKSDASIPQTEIPNVQFPDVKDRIPKVEMPNVAQEVNEAVKAAETKMSSVKKVQDGIKEVNDQGPEKLNSLAQMGEKKVEDVAEVKAVGREVGKMSKEQEKYVVLIKRYQDEKLLRDEIKRKTRIVANDYFKENADKLKAAQEKLTLAKSNATKIKSLSDLFKRRSTELENKKYYQRLVPGANFQIYNKGIVSVDFGLQIGYRITPSITLGMGYLHRWAFSDKFSNFVKDSQLYGGRAYADVRMVKNFFVHGEFEAAHVVPSYQTGAIEEEKAPVLGSYFGIGKRIKLSRNLRGYFLGLYRFDVQGEMPEMHKFNARVGLEYIFKKRLKKLF
ncbi:hypothetical protein SAMN04488109_1797 [Chryseolinea serpens]|uniref:Outer membrane protein beta-barrel domain-containing protein n=1 Tax=Chryseolinea serpens TaxID=947013 RepID=A0A1M5MKK4_9BACT|nr:hypothetical protein [Chryseolinea serpens]SHG77910.1 hypothetical protein SAMN04488109_1797 [Chryseolinea serpens]